MWHKCNSTSITLAFLLFCLLFSHEMYLYWLFNAFNFKSISSNYLTLCYYNYYNNYRMKSEKWESKSDYVRKQLKNCVEYNLCAPKVMLHVLIYTSLMYEMIVVCIYTQSFYMLIIVDIINYYTYNSKVISICSYSFTFISFLEIYC